MRVHARSLVVCGVLLVALLLVAVVGIGTGDFPLSARRRARDAGRPAATAASEFIVETLRLPRVAVGACSSGAALGIAGAIFQSISRNPLGSPDMIGFTTGSVTGARARDPGDRRRRPAQVAARRDRRRPRDRGDRLPARAARRACRATGWCSSASASPRCCRRSTPTCSRARRARTRTQAAHWLIGSLNGRGWEHVWPVAAALVVLRAGGRSCSRGRCALLEMGDDAARALGVAVERVAARRWCSSAVGLTAVATASAGPIAFVALAAPQIARRLTRAAGPGLVCAGADGRRAAGRRSDLAAQRLLGVATCRSAS